MPQRLQTSMSLYSNNLCGLVILSDSKLRTGTGIVLLLLLIFRDLLNVLVDGEFVYPTSYTVTYLQLTQHILNNLRYYYSINSFLAYVYIHEETVAESRILLIEHN